MILRQYAYKFVSILVVLFLYSLQGYTQVTATPTLGTGGGGNSPLNNIPGMNFGRGGIGGNVQTDSLGNIKSDWDDTPAVIHYTHILSNIQYNIDTSLTFFHRNSKLDKWGRNLGNEGLAAYDMIFNPTQRIGLRSGYHGYDLYKLEIDSVRFYNTTRPYSDFSYMMGPKRQQFAKLLHTQNVNPNWNLAAEVINLNSPGVYKLQATRDIVAHISSNYKSENSRYQLKTAFIYQRFIQEENGGIVNDSLLSIDAYSFRSLIDVNFQSLGSSSAIVFNTQKEMQFSYKHQYAFIGVYDTTYNEDSTAMTVNFTPRLTLHHTFNIKRQQNIFKDIAPEEQRYYDFNNTLYSFATGDSVYGNQQWLQVENKFGLSGTLGKSDNNVSLEAGIGNRVDRFVHGITADSSAGASNNISNYIYGKLFKEAQTLKQWSYGANAAFYFSGPALGNFLLDAHLGTVIKNTAILQIGFKQSLSNPEYFTEHYKTNYYSFTNDFDASSITNLWGSLVIPKLKVGLDVRNLLQTNYVYLDSNFTWQQQAEPFNVTQVSLKKNFNWGLFYSENEGIYQQITGNAPVNLPQLMLRHQLRIETPLFKKNLHFTFGVEGRYHTNYTGDGYIPYLNQFYYQNTYMLQNKPELMVFFNFKVRAFRAFVVFDQLQQLFWTNNIYAQGYPAPNTLFKFGFSWVLYN